MERMKKAMGAREKGGLDALFEDVRGREGGLTREEREERLGRFGPNEVSPPQGPGLGEAVWNAVGIQGTVAVVVSVGVFVMGVVHALRMDDKVATGVVAALLALNVLATLGGMAQRVQAATSASARQAGLANLVTNDATVRVDNEWTPVPASSLVPGDVIQIRAGEKVPADCILTLCSRMMVDESWLTGETTPVRKNAEPVSGASADEMAVLRARNVAFAQSIVVEGQGEAVVITTADATVMGGVAALMVTTSSDVLPTAEVVEATRAGASLQMGWLLLAVLGTVVLAVRDASIDDGLVFGILIFIVGMTTSLPLMTITVSVAATLKTMIRANVLVRSLNAVSALSRVDVVVIATSPRSNGEDVDAEDELFAPLGLDVVRCTSYDSHRTVNAAYTRGQTPCFVSLTTADVPTLRRAAVGVSMGISGTEAEKETSDVILLDDSLASLARGVNVARTLSLGVARVVASVLVASVVCMGVVAVYAAGVALTFPPLLLASLVVVIIVWMYLFPTRFARPVTVGAPGNSRVLAPQVLLWVAIMALLVLSLSWAVALISFSLGGGQISRLGTSVWSEWLWVDEGKAVEDDASALIVSFSICLATLVGLVFWLPQRTERSLLLVVVGPAVMMVETCAVSEVLGIVRPSVDVFFAAVGLTIAACVVVAVVHLAVNPFWDGGAERRPGGGGGGGGAGGRGGGGGGVVGGVGDDDDDSDEYVSSDATSDGDVA